MAQEIKLVTGNVLCEDYCEGILYPAVGLLVSVEGDRSRTTLTDIDGNFRINVSEGVTLVFSYLGFETQKEMVGERSVINIILEEDYQDLGLPSVYPKYSKVWGASKLAFNDAIQGYSFDVVCTLPYTVSERCGTPLYDKIKSKLAFGLNISNIDAKNDNNLISSLYLRSYLPEFLNVDIRTENETRYSLMPYAVAGLYLHSKDKLLKSQNLLYGVGLNAAFSRDRFHISADINFRGYVKESSFNNLNFEIFPKIRWIPHWIKPSIGYQYFMRESSYSNFFCRTSYSCGTVVSRLLLILINSKVEYSIYVVLYILKIITYLK